MSSPTFRIVAAFVIMLAVLLYLFHGTVASMQQPHSEIHSTLQPGQKQP